MVKYIFYIRRQCGWSKRYVKKRVIFTGETRRECQVMCWGEYVGWEITNYKRIK